MSRLASQAKMGHYPTPPKVIEQIRELFSFSPGSRCVDTCYCIIYQKDILSIQDIQSVSVIIEPTPDKLYDLLDAKYPTPLLPDWKYELYDMFVTHSPNTMQLRTLGYDSAVEIELPSQEELESKVLDIVSSEPLTKAS